MTSRERVQLAIQHKEADRIAIHDGPWGTTVERWRKEGLPEDQSPHQYFGYEFHGFGGNNTLQLPHKVMEETDEYVIATNATPVDPPVTRADNDLTEWRTQVVRLPGGLSHITQSAGPPVTHEITVFWDEERKGATLGAGDGNCPPADNSELRCLQLTM